jgi:hypothetical protein
MSLSQCNFNDKDAIKANLASYEEAWTSAFYQRNVVSELDIHAGVEAREFSQTDYYEDDIPVTPGDFTATFEKDLKGIFTSDKVVTKMLGPYNCNMLYRQTQAMPDIIVYSDDNYTALHPLGEPGRDLGNHASRVSHLMVVKHGDGGPMVINDMLPSSAEELKDLDNRLSFLDDAYEALRMNKLVSQCGKNVITRSADMNLSPDITIRSFMAKQIASFSPEFRAGRPGYKLLSENGLDYAGGGEVVLEAVINHIFGDNTLKPVMMIQGPEDCSQLLSHIHGYLLKPGQELPQTIKDNYICASTIWTAKDEMAEEAKATEEAKAVRMKAYSDIWERV